MHLWDTGHPKEHSRTQDGKSNALATTQALGALVCADNYEKHGTFIYRYGNIQSRPVQKETQPDVKPSPEQPAKLSLIIPVTAVLPQQSTRRRLPEPMKLRRMRQPMKTLRNRPMTRQHQAEHSRKEAQRITVRKQKLLTQNTYRILVKMTEK